MAHHGVQTFSLARAHQRTQTASLAHAPVTITTPPSTTTITTPSTTVSLQTPRPDTHRHSNEYVDTPFRPPKPLTKPPKPSIPPRLPIRLPIETPTVITKQPETVKHCVSVNNIICQECGKCKCESCRLPKRLPERWICDNTCLCSTESVIDYVSCLCCVKGLYYHCSESDVGSTCADDPCSCAPTKRLARWGCLSALAAVLPCLLCYWPLRACQRAVEAAYARHSRAGCRCPNNHAPTPEKRLLDSSPEF